MKLTFIFNTLKRYGAIFAICNLIFTPVSAQTVTIAALGDSLTQGYGLPVNDGFVPRLQNWLTKKGHDVRVMNAGVSGDTTAGGLSRVAWTLSDDIDAVIVNLGGNDFLRGIMPDVSRKNLRGILTYLKDKNVPVLLVGMKAPQNFGDDYKREFDTIYPELAQEFNTFFYPDYFAPLLVNDRIEQARSKYIQPDGIHPNAAGVIKLVNGIGPAVDDLLNAVEKSD